MAQQDDNDWLDNCRHNGGDRYERREVYCDISQDRGPAAGGTISLEGLRNGGISVTGSSGSQITVKTRVRVTGRTQAEAKSIAGQIRTVIRGNDVYVDGPRDNDDNHWNAELIATVPQRSDLRVGTRNGPVMVKSVTGTLDLQTSNGPLSLIDLAGNVHARTSNGPLSISLTGSKWEGAGLEARTTNGPLTINIPEGYNAHLESGTTNGPVSLGFPITVVGRITRDISTDLGSGGATIRATTTNGPLTIRRR
jgi:DUF4097 and DUF4098 domain-containing protein YvlB